MNVEIDMTEMLNLANDLGARAVLVARRSAKAVGEAAELVETTAKRDAPRGETGNLIDSIRTTGSALEREVKANAYYSIFVEFGTSKMAPQPFMMPAGDKGEAKLMKDLNTIISEAL